MQTKKIKWNQLPDKKKARFAAQGLAQLALTVITLRDIRRRPAGEIKGSKGLWTLLALFPPVGPAAYFLLGRKR